MMEHKPIVVLHTPHLGPSAGYRGECTLGCCVSTVWRDSEVDALADALYLITAPQQPETD